MHSISSLISSLQHDFPQFQFTAGTDFRWSPQEKTIYYVETSTDTASLLHELAHGLLSHATYTKDISLLEMERDAWHYAQDHLAEEYKVAIDDELIQGALDTYRDWLHARSTCPSCHATGLQTKKFLYRCLVCHEQWRVNDARICALRRYKL